MPKLPVLMFYAMIEAPLALLMDTLLLPITVPVTLLRRPEEETALDER